MPSQKVIRCVLSGSFRKNRPGLISAYSELVTCGCQVLSPHRLEFSSEKALFVKDKAEEHLSEETIESHHLVSIKQSDFVWLHAPEGYIGLSTALEIGYAAAHHVPVFTNTELSEPVFRPFVHIVPSVYRGLETLSLV